MELAVELATGIRGASIHVVPGGGHGPIYGHERADFEQRALAFLASRPKPLDAHPKSN